MEPVGSIRFWIIKYEGFWYLYDYWLMRVLKPPEFPQAAEFEALIPRLEKLRRAHGERPGKPYVIDMRNRAVTVEELRDDDD